MKTVTFTSPDMSDLFIPEGTILRYTGYKEDTAPKRRGWYWREFEVLSYPGPDLDF